MPRRPPPSSLRLHQGPLPVRGIAKHTLPSVPRPAVVPQGVSRSSRTPHVRSISSSSSSSSSSYSSTSSSAYLTAAEIDILGFMHGRPTRRSTERALEASGLSLPPLPSSATQSPSNSMAASPISSSGSSMHLPRQPADDRKEDWDDQSGPQRGPWDHSRAASLPFDVGSVLALPKPVAISP